SLRRTHASPRSATGWLSWGRTCSPRRVGDQLQVPHPRESVANSGLAARHVVRRTFRSGNRITDIRPFDTFLGRTLSLSRFRGSVRLMIFLHFPNPSLA